MRHEHRRLLNPVLHPADRTSLEGYAPATGQDGLAPVGRGADEG